MLSAQVICLALTMYHEGRGEGPEGMVAIGQSVLNRSGATSTHKDVCSIVHRGGPKPLWKCQYTWYCDGRSDTPQNRDMWTLSLTLSQAVLAGWVGQPALKGANCYYAFERRSEPPRWATSKAFRFQLGGHKFYVC